MRRDRNGLARREVREVKFAERTKGEGESNKGKGEAEEGRSSYHRHAGGVEMPGG